jgi:hypothetical protein
LKVAVAVLSLLVVFELEAAASSDPLHFDRLWNNRQLLPVP